VDIQANCRHIEIAVKDHLFPVTDPDPASSKRGLIYFDTSFLINFLQLPKYSSRQEFYKDYEKFGEALIENKILGVVTPLVREELYHIITSLTYKHHVDPKDKNDNWQRAYTIRTGWAMARFLRK
jgi:predicted nucleic acid-binding protein